MVPPTLPAFTVSLLLTTTEPHMALFLPSTPQAAVWGTLVRVCVVMGALEGAFRHHRIPHSPSCFRIVHTQGVCVCVVYSLMQWPSGPSSTHRTTLTHITSLIIADTYNRRIHSDPLQLLHDPHDAGIRQKTGKTKDRWWQKVVCDPLPLCTTKQDGWSLWCIMEKAYIFKNYEGLGSIRYDKLVWGRSQAYLSVGGGSRPM